MVPSKIMGYRDLSAREIELINAVKLAGEGLRQIVGALTELPPDQVDRRWVSIGETHLQQGLMALSRAIARPTSF